MAGAFLILILILWLLISAIFGAFKTKKTTAVDTSAQSKVEAVENPSVKDLTGVTHNLYETREAELKGTLSTTNGIRVLKLNEPISVFSATSEANKNILLKDVTEVGFKYDRTAVTAEQISAIPDDTALYMKGNLSVIYGQVWFYPDAYTIPGTQGNPETQSNTGNQSNTVIAQQPAYSGQNTAGDLYNPALGNDSYNNQSGYTNGYNNQNGYNNSYNNQNGYNNNYNNQSGYINGTYDPYGNYYAYNNGNNSGSISDDWNILKGLADKYNSVDDIYNAVRQEVASGIYNKITGSQNSGNYNQNSGYSQNSGYYTQNNAGGNTAAGNTGSAAYILPNSSSVRLTSADINGLSLQLLNYAKNEIYARHGRIFDSPELNTYFSSKSWYRGTVSGDDFSDDVLSDIEVANIDLLREREYSLNPDGYPLQ